MKSFALMVAGGVLLYALVSRKAPDLFKALFNLAPPSGTSGASLADPPVADPLHDSRPPPGY